MRFFDLMTAWSQVGIYDMTKAIEETAPIRNALSCMSTLLQKKSQYCIHKMNYERKMSPVFGKREIFGLLKKDRVFLS